MRAPEEPLQIETIGDLILFFFCGYSVIFGTFLLIVLLLGFMNHEFVCKSSMVRIEYVFPVRQLSCWLSEAP